MEEEILKIEKKHNKKKIITVAATFVFAIAILSIGTGITFAFFTGTDTVKNTFTMGDIEVELTEPNWNDEVDGKNIIPGTTLVKDPTITELKGSSYSRIMVNFTSCNSDYDLTETQLSLIKNMIYYDKSYDNTKNPKTDNLIEGNQYSLAELNQMVLDGKITRAYNDADFSLDQARWSSKRLVYNYNEVLNENESKVLFTNLVIPTDYDNDDINLLTSYYDGTTYNTCEANTSIGINVKAEAIQSYGIESTRAAFNTLEGDQRISLDDASIFEYALLGDGTYEITGIDFSKIPNRIDTLTIPSTYNDTAVTSIGMYAIRLNRQSFANQDDQKRIRKVIVSEGITSIGNSALEGDYIEEIILPSSLTTLVDGALSNNIFDEVTLPSNLTTIGRYAFAYNSLKEIVIPSSVTSIGENAFKNLGLSEQRAVLTSVTINGKSSTADFESYPTESPFTWKYQSGLTDADIVWNG